MTGGRHQMSQNIKVAPELQLDNVHRKYTTFKNREAMPPL